MGFFRTSGGGGGDMQALLRLEFEWAGGAVGLNPSTFSGRDRERQKTSDKSSSFLVTSDLQNIRIRCVTSPLESFAQERKAECCRRRVWHLRGRVEERKMRDYGKAGGREIEEVTKGERCMVGQRLEG